MASLIPDDGLDWFRNKSVGEEGTTRLYYVVVGTGTTEPSADNQTINNEAYRSNDSNSNCTIQKTSNVGETRCSISVAGGTEVASGTDITELGVHTNTSVEELAYHEVRDPVTIDSGERVTFEFTIDAISG